MNGIIRGATRSRRLRLQLAGAIAAAAALALVGCSSGTSGGGTTPSESAKSAEVAPPAIKKAGQLQVCSAFPLGAKPLFYYDENNQPAGMEIDLAKAIAKQLGLEYVPVATAFPSLIPTLQGGQCDVIMSSLFIKPEREKVVDFVPYMESGAVLVTLTSEKSKITGLDESLCGLKIAATVGASAVPNLEEQSKKCESDGKPAIVLTQLDSAATGLKTLEAKQVDAYAGTTPDMTYAVAQNDALTISGDQFAAVTVGAAVNKGNDELRSAIQDAFDAIKKDGTYDKILAKRGLEQVAYKG